MERMMLLSDPQTSGGLLIAVDPDSLTRIEELFKAYGNTIDRIGSMTNDRNDATKVFVL
jgi:selenophosphate synthase